MTVQRAMRLRRRTEGDVGIEIEVEGSRLPHTDEHWNAEHDGSLRGESREYVLRRPMSVEGADEALAYLDRAFKESRSRISNSNRAGVHVHVNCQRLSMVHLYNYMVLYLILEEALVDWCGPFRVGNHFCLRAKDAEYLIYTLTRAAEDGEHFREHFGRDDLRYASMNVRALTQYGSLEFRAMRSTRDTKLIGRWAKLLVNLRESAQQFDDPTAIIAGTSGDGLEAFVRNVLDPDNAEVVLGVEDWETKVMDGMRRAQEVAYARDWGTLALPKKMVGGIQVSADFEDDFPPMDV